MKTHGNAAIDRLRNIHQLGALWSWHWAGQLAFAFFWKLVQTPYMRHNVLFHTVMPTRYDCFFLLSSHLS